MKVLKAAAVVAGSLTLAGAAAPAFAAGPGDLPPMSLNGALDTLTSQPTLDVNPVDTNLLDPSRKDNAIGTVTEATQGLNSGGSLLGGLPTGR
ncbi:hypothetical protein GTW43_05750 [Streptomyces sp. SID5785]|uniref:hypothetical protein n=1 Tax=Streptomyces sp. SID5785 TaxID=2690309 RepID=UPI001360E556|nr:hypothetical protein [Streptomyces sp. SID5785]MZD04587.1 hypothetical protein [Streptomyces sp. SID5785]